DAVYELQLLGGADGLFASTVNRGTNFDTVLYLRSICDEATSELICHDDLSGSNRRSLLRLNEPLGPGRYWMIVDGAGAAESGAYRLQMSALLNEGRGCNPSRQDIRCKPNLA